MGQVSAIINAAVIDVDEASVTEASVIVDGTRIVEVDADARIPEGARVIDAAGAYAIPGLIDAHVHVTSAIGDSAFVPRLSPYYTAARASRILGAMLRRGFTTVRDVGGADWGLARAVEEGLFGGPRIHFGGPAFSQTGGHGDMRTLGDPGPLGVDGIPRVAEVVDGVEPLRRAAREELRKGAHHIKIFLSGGVAASPTDQFDAPQYSDDEVRVVVEEAAAARRYVTAHAYTTAEIMRGIRCGVRSFEHGNLLDREGAAALVDADAFLVPTLATYDVMAREGSAHGVPENPRWPFARVLSWAQEALEEAERAGANIVYGTDLLGTMHDYQSREFALRADIQSPQRILAGATTIAARLLGEEGHRGRIAPGYVADIVLVDADPLEDIRILAAPERHLRSVFQGGSTVYASVPAA